MNWKNVFLLIDADIKSYRLVSGKRFRRFRENKPVTYALYVGACILGSLIGWLAGSFYVGISDSQLRDLVLQGAVSFFISFPTIALLYGLVFTQMSQFQRIGAKVSVQPLYWFPITWEEHTLASIIANILGIPMIVTVFIVSGITMASIFIGLIPMALLTVFALIVSVLIASATTEISKVLQVRVSGAITKAAGRAAIWVRLVGSILFFIAFYAIYFSIYSQANPLALLEMVTSGQKTLWFIPYVWPGIALSYLAGGLVLETAIFSVASIAFICFLFLAAAKLNIKYGLYEMPSIRISRGVYVPRAGFLRRLGFSPLEAAVMRKDFKAFTRRLELAYIFLLPVISGIMPILTTMRSAAEAPGAPAPHVLNSFVFAYLALLPGTIMAIMLGCLMIGMEGEPIWYVYSSPITASSLVKAKYSFAMLFSLAVTLICVIIAGSVWTPSVKLTMSCSMEAVFLIFSLSMVSLSFGIRGAEFRELPRPRMIRPAWALINGLVCIALALAIVSPVIPYALDFFFQNIQGRVSISLPIPEAYLYIALPISGIIASALTYAFYRVALKNAEKFLANAERYESHMFH